MKLFFEISPFVHQSGTIEVSDNLPEEDWEKYIKDNLHKASLGEMNTSYKGIDIDYIEQEDE